MQKSPPQCLCLLRVFWMIVSVLLWGCYWQFTDTRDSTQENLCRIYNINTFFKRPEQWWFCYNKRLDPDLLLTLHQLHEVLCSWWKGGAHLLHHGLHTVKVNAWVYTRPTLSVREHLQFHTHMGDGHRRAATEREQLYGDTTLMLSRQRSVCVFVMRAWILLPALLTFTSQDATGFSSTRWFL